MRRFLSILCFLLAGVGIGMWVWSVAHEKLSQRHDERVFEKERASPPPVPVSPSVEAPRGQILGRLEIDKIHLRAMVREGDDDHTLAVAVGHIPGTAFPGQDGNVALAAHRDRIFSHLGEVTKNDEIRLETPSATFVYQVDNMSIVKPQDVAVLLPGSRDQLTLITCYPFHYIGSAPKRYVVKAHLLAENLADGSGFKKRPVPGGRLFTRASSRRTGSAEPRP